MSQRKLASVVMSIIAFLILSNCYSYESAPLVRHKRTLLTALAVGKVLSNVADDVIERISEDTGYDIDYIINDGLQATITGAINNLPTPIPLSNIIPNVSLPPQLTGALNLTGINRVERNVKVNPRMNIDDDYYDASDYAY